jgi:hypothetical protein
VFTIFNHLTDIRVVHDIIVIFFTCHFLGLEFFDTFMESFDFIVKILFSPVIKFISGRASSQRKFLEGVGGFGKNPCFS